MADPSHEVQIEQETVTRLYARLDELREQTRRRLARVRRSGPSGSPQNRSERDAFATLYEDRAAQLESVEDRLCFGRLDLHDGALRYIGRIGLTDAEHTSLLTDWRAPAAQAFYRATAAHAYDVVRRRHIVTKGRRVVSLEDELLDLSVLDSGSTAHLGHLSGEGALLAAMAAGRTGRMGDIVATIQAEQDTIIRAPLEGALVVQGGPGTGKTAVALHRAAYLLYAHRKKLERSGVLLIGPSTSFLRYIDQVLPSLGETGVVSTTIGHLFPGVATDRDDDDAVARIKGDHRFARVIRRAVRARQRVPRSDVEIRVDGVDLLIRRKDISAAIHRARRFNRPHNIARVAFVKDMLNALTDQYFEHLGTDPDPHDRAHAFEELRTTREVRITLNLAWMPLTPHGLVQDLLAKPHRLAEAAPHLDARQRELLHRPKDAPWTTSDIPLLDEAAELLGTDDQAEKARNRELAQQREHELDYARQVLKSSGGSAIVSAQMLAERFADTGPYQTTAERAIADRTWTYGHIIVDEAQELSPMAWRMLLRRCPTQSMTIVGDIAQTSSPAGARNWQLMLDPMIRSWKLTELTVNYRTPAQIARTATQVAKAAGLPLSPMTSAREVDNPITITRTTDHELRATITETIARTVPEVVQSDGTGRIAVIAPAQAIPELRRHLQNSSVAHLLPQSDHGANRTESPLVILTARESKGLEFDVVILAQPTGIAAASDLYVAMTRPTKSLHIITTGPLPHPLGEPEPNAPIVRTSDSFAESAEPGGL